MEFIEVIKKRRSTRKYKAKEVKNELIEKIIDAARLAPTGMNSQPWKFVVVRDKKNLKKISQLYTSAREKLKIYPQDTSFVENIALIVVCSSKEFTWARSDCFLAIENLILAATNEALGSLCLGALMAEQEELRKMLKIPDNYEIILPVVVGYPDEQPKMPQKKELKDILSYEQF